MTPTFIVLLVLLLLVLDPQADNKDANMTAQSSRAIILIFFINLPPPIIKSPYNTLEISHLSINRKIKGKALPIKIC